MNRRTLTVSAAVVIVIAYMVFAHQIGNLVGRFGLFAIVLGTVWILGRFQWLNPTTWIRWCIASFIGLLTILLLIAAGTFERFGRLGENVIALPAEILWAIAGFAFQVGLVIAGVWAVIWVFRNLSGTNYPGPD